MRARRVIAVATALLVAVVAFALVVERGGLLAWTGSVAGVALLVKIFVLPSARDMALCIGVAIIWASAWAGTTWYVVSTWESGEVVELGIPVPGGTHTARVWILDIEESLVVIYDAAPEIAEVLMSGGPVAFERNGQTSVKHPLAKRIDDVPRAEVDEIFGLMDEKYGSRNLATEVFYRFLGRPRNRIVMIVKLGEQPATFTLGSGMGRMDGKVAIVTGGAMGLGEADSSVLAREGARVVVTDINRERGEAVAKAIGGEYRFHDVTNEGQWIELIAHVVRQYGALHVLVNNAGIVEPGNIETQAYDAYKRQMAVSADGTFLGCRYAVPAIARSGGGSIINMASIASKRGIQNVVAYCAAKGAVEALSRAVAVHCLIEKNNVRCNSIHPGSIDTPMVRGIGAKLVAAGLVNQQTPGTPAPARPRLGEPLDIANLVLFLASDESKFISGQEFVPDGGISAIMAPFPS